MEKLYSPGATRPAHVEVDFVKVATVIVTPRAVASKKTPPLRTAVMAGTKAKIVSLKFWFLT